MNMHRLLLALKMVKGLGNRALADFINKGLLSESLLSMASDDLYNRFSILRVNVAKEISNNLSGYLAKADNVLKDCETAEIKILAYNDKNYPILLKQINDPPAVLFYKGETSILDGMQAIAVIGTRDCTDTGGKIAFKVSQYFAKKKYVIVSGLAKGIDTFAHQGALRAKGKTIAVLCDIKNILPKGNSSLAEDIVKAGGLLVAENLPGIAVRPYHFVARDRIQSALSLGVFPIETDIKGGTMHTVDFARRQNRLLFCPNPNKVKQYKTDISQIRGIHMLLGQKTALPFTSKNYIAIERLLKKKQRQLKATASSLFIDS